MWTDNQLNIFKSLFKGREDVFAKRWEKGNKSGYVPAYQYDPYQYRLHKISGGSLKTYQEKEYLPLTDEQIKKHLDGGHLIGVYPLLKDNTSWFIAADFDRTSWVDDCRKFIKACEQKKIPVYLERSRSGQGGHVWIFFDQPYAALKSRSIITKLLERSGAFSIFDKDSSFDRLFPNQDYLSGKGLGNLIALPLHKPAVENGNSCFIDPNTLEPFKDQWSFLKSIRRVTVAELDKLYDTLADSSILHETPPDGKLVIRLSNTIHLNRSGLSLQLINFLKEELNFTNNEFLIKKKLGKNTWGIQRYFKFVEESNNNVIVPRGFIGRLIRFCKERNIEYDFQDERTKRKLIAFQSSIQLKDYQKIAYETATKKDFGIIVAPPGAGKTVIGLSIIATKKQPALIIVHRKQLADQWMDRIETFLNIPKKDIGKIGQGSFKPGKAITVALIQSLDKAIQNSSDGTLENAFGTILVDECHHVPAETYRNTISRLNAFFIYGLTATPFRKYNDGKIIFTHLGEIIADIKTKDIESHLKARVVIRDTDLSVPFDSKSDKFETLSKVLVHDTARNKLIFNDITKELNTGKKVVIITERKDHIDSLNQYLKQFYKTITLSGDDSESSRNTKWKLLHEVNFQALITTGQYFGEGSDLQNLECIFLVYPFSFEGKLVQYIGRVQRSKSEPVIYDYRDYKIEYLENLFQKRNAYYKKFLTEGPLFDFYEPQENSASTFSIDKRISVLIEQLEFRFGIIAFIYQLSENGRDLQFEVENSHVRPEFEVLKPYFAKVLKARSIKATIKVKVENGKLIYNYAISSDLEKINREIIESVRFRFVSQKFFGKLPTTEDSILLNIDELQSKFEGSTGLYDSGEELLEEILKYKEGKHHRHLRYLAQKHENSVLKIRFVLVPFSFVFLLAGDQQYHIIWETLDTEEATYIWHIEKNKAVLRKKLQEIDQDLGLIRAKGRQTFLENMRGNFSRIVHDYTDNQKGFIVWRDALEERLV
ncbi:MAG: TOTE conflict system archaeo-eukaryotic primase domain-containing protein [Bacteroidota bacterium]